MIVNLRGLTSGNALKLANVTIYAGIFAMYTLLRLIKRFSSAESRRKLMAVTAAICLVITSGLYSGFAMAAGSSQDTQQGRMHDGDSGQMAQTEQTTQTTQSTQTTQTTQPVQSEQSEQTTEEQITDDAQAAVESLDESTSEQDTSVSTSGQYKDGIYTGSAEGFRSTIEVEVTIESGMITNIQVTQENDTPQFFQRAESVIDSIIGTQSADVSAVSGATYSSTGIINAVKEALSQAV